MLNTKVQQITQLSENQKSKRRMKMRKYLSPKNELFRIILKQHSYCYHDNFRNSAMLHIYLL